DQFILLVLAAIHLGVYELTDFQLKERLKEEPPQRAQLLKKLHKALPLIRRQQQVKIAVLFAVGAVLLTHLVDPPLAGFVWVLFITLVIPVIRRIEWVRTQAHVLFESMLDTLIRTATVVR